MKTLDELLFQIIIHLEKGMDILVSNLLTIEGLITLIITFFAMSLIIQVRS